MRAIIITTPLLVLLFSMCGAQTQSTQTEVQAESQSTGAAAAAAEVTTQLDVSAELRELRDMVVELRVLLTVTQNELQNTKSLLYNMETENDAQNAAQTTEINTLKMETAAQKAELAAVKTRLSDTKTDAVNLERETKTMVAFSAGLGKSGYIESGNTEMNLAFPSIITNVGEAYSGVDGFFKAPFRGVYYFRFNVMDNSIKQYIYIDMYKNGERLMHLHEYNSDAGWTYLSSSLTVQLEVGDVVNLRLPAGYRLYDNRDNHSTFSGFLIFPL